MAAHAPPADRELKKQFATWFQAADTGELLGWIRSGLVKQSSLAELHAVDGPFTWRTHLITSCRHDAGLHDARIDS